MSVQISNAIVKAEQAITPADDTEVDKFYSDGFYIGGAGTVTFSYKSNPTVKIIKTFADGDTWFGDIYSIDSTGTTAASINGIRLSL